MSAKNRAAKLKKLLEDAYGSSANPWISVVTIENAVMDSGAQDEVQHWIRYGELKKHQGRVGDDNVDGLEVLLRNCGVRVPSEGLVHKVFDESGRPYRVFTDREISHIIGILRFPAPELEGTYALRVKKVEELIGDSYGSSENPWVSKSAAQTARIEADEGDGIAIFGARDICTRRGHRNKERGSPIDGFENLLEKLESTVTERVHIHTLVDQEGRIYQIFTDSEIKELIGILRFPFKQNNSR